MSYQDGLHFNIQFLQSGVRESQGVLHTAFDRLKPSLNSFTVGGAAWFYGADSCGLNLWFKVPSGRLTRIFMEKE